MKSASLLLLVILLFGCGNPSVEKEEILVFEIGQEQQVQIPIHRTPEQISIRNSEEIINCPISGNTAQLPVFESYFEFNDDKNSGFWYDPSRGESYKVLFEIIQKAKRKIDPKDSIQTVWEAVFGTAENAYPARLVLLQTGNSFFGNIQTKLGDYRYLHGKLNPDSLLVLQTFDGSHLFLLTARMQKNQLTEGMFYSGNHYSEPWSATVNLSFNLPESFALDHANDMEIRFTALSKKLDTILFSPEFFKNKLHILQIMGTWCPNCMDESRLLTSLYEKYKDKGLSITALAFERYPDAARAFIAIEKAQKDLGIDYPVLFGGSSNKQTALQKFPFLDSLLAFPTCLFIDSNAKIIDLHTGFNGPATGRLYSEERQRFERIIRNQLGLAQ